MKFWCACLFLALLTAPAVELGDRYRRRVPPFHDRPRQIEVEQRIDLAERIAIQREIIKLDEEARRRVLSQSEKNDLQDLRARLLELEKRK